MGVALLWFPALIPPATPTTSRFPPPKRSSSPGVDPITSKEQPMKALRLTIPVALLMLLGVVRPARSADRVLVPGDPALTQSTVDQERGNLEWVLDLKMSEKMRTLHRSSLVADWKGWDRDARA